MQQVQGQHHCRDWSGRSEPCSSPQSGLERNTWRPSAHVGKVRRFIQNTSGPMLDVEKSPICCLSNAEKLFDSAIKSIPSSIECTFDKQRTKNIGNQVSVIIVAPTEKTLDVILKTPMVRTVQQFALKHVRFAWGCDHSETLHGSIPSPTWMCLFRLPFQSMKSMVSSPLMTPLINSMLW